MRIRIMFTVCLAASLHFQTLLSAFQESGQSDGIAGAQQQPIGSHADLAKTLDLLKVHTKQMKTELSLIDQNPNAMAVEITMQSGSNSRLNEKEKVSEINRNIKLLQELFEKKKRRQMITLDSLSKAQTKEKAGSRTRDTVRGAKPAEVQRLPIPDPQDPTQATTIPNIPIVTAKQVLPEIVDAIELGNSLFMAGNLEQALETYGNANRTKLNAYDRTWLLYMMACCHRGLGNLELAESSYREVANDRNGVRFSEAAYDWLDYIRKRKMTLTAVNEYSRKADALLKKGAQYENETRPGKSN